MQNRFNKKSILRFLGNSLAKPLLNILCKTIKVSEVNKSAIQELANNNQNIVFAFWHGTMLLPWYLIKEFSPSTIISKSKDGDLLANVLTSWHYNVKRGSSSNKGKEILEKLIIEAKNKNNIAITPDGPRGPEKIMKAGAVIIAKKAHIPLVLAGIHYCKKITLKSWDKFEIPYFFSKAKIIYSEPIYISENLSYEETDMKIKELGIKLEELQLMAAQNC